MEDQILWLSFLDGIVIAVVFALEHKWRYDYKIEKIKRTNSTRTTKTNGTWGDTE